MEPRGSRERAATGRGLAVALVLAAVLPVSAASGCAPRGPALPRIESYDFGGETTADIARLRQMAPAEGPEGALSRYALARAHADWLVLGLVQDRDDDVLLRLLAVDLEIGGATPDDRLTLEQLHLTMDAVLEEIGEAGGAGPEARRWAADSGRLLRAVRRGWEQFSPSLVEEIGRLSERAGPAQLAADLLALGWSRLALVASMERPARERPELLVRMAGYFDPETVERLGGGASLAAATRPPSCPSSGRSLRSLSGQELLVALRESCTHDELGLPPGGARMASFELLALGRLLSDLAARRERLSVAESDPLVQAAAPTLARFDRALAALRLPLPLPVAGPDLPAPPVLEHESPWQPAGAVVVLGTAEPRVALWPVLAAGEDGLPGLPGAGLGLRPSGDDLSSALEEAWNEASELGLRRSVAVVAPGDTDAGAFAAVVDRIRAAGAARIDVVTTSAEGRLSTIAVGAELGAARQRTSEDRRAIVVLRPDSVLVGDANGRWTEIEDWAGAVNEEPLMAALGRHLQGRGNRGCILAVRPGTAVSRAAQILVLLAPLPDGTTAGGRWRVWLDPEEPPAPSGSASTASGALALHRVRLRDCYESFLREGGEGEGLVVLEIDVEPTGRVGAAQVLRSELGPRPGLEACLVGEARRIRFPRAAGNRTIHVPLRLVPQEE